MTITPLDTTNHEAVPSDSSRAAPSRTLVWIFTGTYGFSTLFYIANFYSYGIAFSYPSILLAVALLSPIFGASFILLDALLLKMTGKLVGGTANTSSLRFALAYSKAPSVLLTIVWLMLLAADPASVFIQDASNGAAVAMIFSYFGAMLWSFCLLTKHVKKLQEISTSRAFFNTFVAFCLSFLSYATLLFIARYIHISRF